MSLVISIILIIIIFYMFRKIGILEKTYIVKTLQKDHLVIKVPVSKEKDIPYAIIKAIYPTTYAASDITKNRNLCIESDKIDCVIESRDKEISRKLYDRYNYFMLEAYPRNDPDFFFHTKGWKIRKAKLFMMLLFLIIFPLIVSIVWVVMMFKLNCSSWILFLVIPVISSYYIVDSFLKYRSKMKNRSIITRLVLKNNKLYWTNDNDANYEYDLPPKEYCLDTNKGQLIFENGHQLLDLEKLAYWPILRHKLLEALEANNSSLKTE